VALTTTLHTPAITGLIIAGGLARRMGGVDKGLQDFRGRPLLAQVIERLQPQVDSLLINVNHHREAYAGFAHPLISDSIADYAGPLAGLHAGLTACTTPLLAAVPCDAPELPADLVVRLQAALEAGQADVAVAVAGGRRHHACLLCRREVLPGLTHFLVGGGRKVGQWLAGLRLAEAEFTGPEGAAAFANINTLEELKNLEQT
jgi:molybdopterin-guanine dinucleotide biosynthesis protein A